LEVPCPARRHGFESGRFSLEKPLLTALHRAIQDVVQNDLKAGEWATYTVQLLLTITRENGDSGWGRRRFANRLDVERIVSRDQQPNARGEAPH
jgi:hypothetical protein